MAQQREIERKEESNSSKELKEGGVVVAQLVERSLPIPEVCGLNPVIGQNLYL